MARIRQCLTPSTGLSLVNSLMDGMDVQKDLVKRKTNYLNNESGKEDKDTGLDL